MTETKKFELLSRTHYFISQKDHLTSFIAQNAQATNPPAADRCHYRTGNGITLLRRISATNNGGREFNLGWYGDEMLIVSLSYNTGGQGGPAGVFFSSTFLCQDNEFDVNSTILRQFPDFFHTS